MSVNKYDNAMVMGSDGKPLYVLNKELLAKQNVSEGQLFALKASHYLKDIIFEMARNTNEENTIRMLAAVFDALESEQQKLWNFEVDVTQHRFFDFPKCSCPQLDNRDRLGTPYKVHTFDCIVHGKSAVEAASFKE